MPTRKLRGPCPAPTPAPSTGKAGIPKATGTGREHRGTSVSTKSLASKVTK